MNHAPEKLSSLIRLALDDLAKCEADDDYVVDMDVYHEPSPNEGTCRVCLAGSVMAQTLDTPRDVDRVPVWYLDSRDMRRWGTALSALNRARLGDLLGAIREMGFPVPDSYFTNVSLSSRAIRIPRYSDSPSAFRTALKDSAEYLEGLGT